VSGNRVVIIGAGPAGLTAAYELARAGGFEVTVLEASGDIGGISKTVNYKGNRIDIGGHRFFSKSDWVMDWWQNILPIEAGADRDKFEIAYQNKRRTVDVSAEAPAGSDDVMLVRQRLSRIYFEGNFFSYPVKANVETALKLGPARVAKMLASYGAARAFPRAEEMSLEDFMINRFGKELYLTFFKDYTEKVWGVPCNQISAEWGAQRIKGLSVTKAILHAAKAPFRSLGAFGGGTENTSLIEEFLYPKYGPGQMWETTAEKAESAGVVVRRHQKVVGLGVLGDKVSLAIAEDTRNGGQVTIPADYVISTMPVVDLINAMRPAAPESISRIANKLEYRDFITVGLLLKGLKKTAGANPHSSTNLVPDNWIYIQDKGVQVGRLQFFNNWSPHMVADPGTVWVGMEYFCREEDSLWQMSDSDLIALGMREMEKIGLADPRAYLDGMVLRVPKAYPGYYGAYSEFSKVREFTDSIDNLFLVGRNGMHRYNNQDHSMLTAYHAAEAIMKNTRDKQVIWEINIDDDYHEEKAA